MAQKYDGLSQIILQNIGGKENVTSITHCVTRLRFKLKDEDKANTDILMDTDGIVTVMRSGGQYQVVIGNHVPDVFESVVRVGHLENVSAKNSDRAEDTPQEKMSPMNFLISIVTGVFTPFLGVLCACGIIKGFLALFVAVGLLDGAGSTYNILYSLGDAAFYFMPPILGFAAAKRFKLPEMEGILIGLAMVYPYMLASSEQDVSHLFGLPVIMPTSGDYASSIIPVICAVAFAAWFEGLFKKYVPDTIKLFMVPLITLFVTVCLTFLIIGPIASAAANLLAALFSAISNFSTVLLGLVIGGVWQVLVMFGLHWALIPMALSNLTTMGSDNTLVGMYGTTFVQTGACIGIFLKTREKKLKSLAPAAIISAAAGVTEPAIYGITLPKKMPFVRVCIISAIAGAVLCGTGVRQFSIAGMGVFGYTAYIDTTNNDLRGMIISVVVSIACVVAGIVSELIFYKDGEEQNGNEKQAISDAASSGEVTGEDIAAPISGEVLALSDIADEAFASGAMGQGVAIRPSEGKLYAPADGVITVFFPTGHAIGLQTEGGAELLIHVGMDTVTLDGKGFTPKKKQGDRVKKGELLLEFDLNVIKEAGLVADTPVLVTNTDAFAGVEAVGSGVVAHGDNIIQTL